MDYHEIVKKLVGPINPTAEAHEDEIRYKNLIQMAGLVNKLVEDIDNVSHLYKDSKMASLKKAADCADEFLTNTLGIPKDS